MNDNFENEQNQLFEQFKKTERNGSLTNDEKMK